MYYLLPKPVFIKTSYNKAGSRVVALSIQKKG